MSGKVHGEATESKQDPESQRPENDTKTHCCVTFTIKECGSGQTVAVEIAYPKLVISHQYTACMQV